MPVKHSSSIETCGAKSRSRLHILEQPLRSLCLCGEKKRLAVKWNAAIWAGIVAGVVSALAQMLLWALFTDTFPSALFRDARLAAAILMGRDVLPPPASFDPWIMLVAACIHFALSIVYGVMVAIMTSRTGTGTAISIGAGFGAALYVVNLYGFTAIFPWFAEVRDWITLAAHIVFGVTAAATYKALEKR